MTDLRPEPPAHPGESNVVPLRKDSDDREYRLPPHNTEAEQALLGAILVNNSAYHHVAEFLLPEHFAEAVHARIYAAIGKLVDRGEKADPVTLKGIFDRDGMLQEIGGAAYLARLAGCVITVVNAKDYGRIVYDTAIRRQVIALCEETADAAHAYDAETTGTAIVEQLEERLYGIAESKTGPSRTHAVFDSAMQAVAQTQVAFQRGGGVTGVPSGIYDIDQVTGGLHESDLVILAGRPSMGKTALACTIAHGAAEHFSLEAERKGRKPQVVAFYSLEMSDTQLAQRLMARRTAISVDAQRNGRVNANDMDRLIEAARWLEGMPLRIDDTPAVTVPFIRRHARRLKRQHGLGLIVVDYLQLMTASKEARKFGPVAATTELSRGLKELAKELEVPVLALSQLSRQVEQREDKRPMLSDLRESGSIEQDADVVMFVFREEYYLGRSEPMRRADESDDKFNDRHERWMQRLEETRGLAEVIFAKNRHGPIRSVRAAFDGVRQQFMDLSERDDLR